MGHMVSSSGLKSDPAKIEAIVEMKPPTDKAGVERLRGTVNYSCTSQDLSLNSLMLYVPSAI